MNGFDRLLSAKQNVFAYDFPAQRQDYAAGTVTPEDNNVAAILAKLGGEQRRRQVFFCSGSVLIMRYPWLVFLADPGIVSILIDSFANYRDRH